MKYQKIRIACRISLNACVKHIRNHFLVLIDGGKHRQWLLSISLGFGFLLFKVLQLFYELASLPLGVSQSLSPLYFGERSVPLFLLNLSKNPFNEVVLFFDLAIFARLR